VIAEETTRTVAMGRRSYWIPGSYASRLPEALNSCLRPLKYKGLKKEMITKIGLYDIVKPTTPESNKSVEALHKCD
jgi:hypothetical protein